MSGNMSGEHAMSRGECPDPISSLSTTLSHIAPVECYNQLQWLENNGLNKMSKI